MFIVRLRSHGLYATNEIQIKFYMYSFDCVDDFILIMVLSVKLVNNKVVDNLLIHLVLKFHSHRL